MKTSFKLVCLFVLAAILAGCGNKTTATNSEDVEMNTETILLVGTLNLKGTKHEVDAEQAARLLPLWQMYQSLISSDTATQEEVDAVIKQIQKSMTSEQMDAIEAMDLKSEDVMAIMQELGLAMRPGGDGMSATPDFSMMPEGFAEGEPPAFSDGSIPSRGDSFPGGGGPPSAGEVMVFSGEGGVGGPEGDFSDMSSVTPGAWQKGVRDSDSFFTQMLVRIVTEYLQGLIHL